MLFDLLRHVFQFEPFRPLSVGRPLSMHALKTLSFPVIPRRQSKTRQAGLFDMESPARRPGPRSIFYGDERPAFKEQSVTASVQFYT
jgi:hypothetical protein